MLAEILRSLSDVPLVNHAPLYRRWPAVLASGRARLSGDDARRLQRMTTACASRAPQAVVVPCSAFTVAEAPASGKFTKSHVHRSPRKVHPL
jgi:hypothetical protein